MLITHISTIYLIQQHGTNTHKEQYLPRLIQGKFGCLLISDSVIKLYYREYQKNKCIKKVLNAENIGIIIRVNKNGNNVEFNFDDKKDDRRSILYKDKFTFSENGITVLCDLFNFQRLLYGILAANFALPILERIKEISQRCSTVISDQVIKKVHRETRDNLRISQQLFYSLFPYSY